MKLNQITDNKGARKTRTRVGRGIGSGLGKTAGRGGKGQENREDDGFHGNKRRRKTPGGWFVAFHRKFRTGDDVVTAVSGKCRRRGVWRCSKPG